MTLTKIKNADQTVGTDQRRSQRIPLSVPVDVSTVDSSSLFSGRCNTIDVNLHGCQFFLTRPFKRGTELLLYVLDTRHSVAAYVVRSMPAMPDMSVKLWKISVEFARPGNCWGVEFPPADW